MKLTKSLSDLLPFVGTASISFPFACLSCLACSSTSEYLAFFSSSVAFSNGASYANTVIISPYFSIILFNLLSILSFVRNVFTNGANPLDPSILSRL